MLTWLSEEHAWRLFAILLVALILIGVSIAMYDPDGDA